MKAPPKIKKGQPKGRWVFVPEEKMTDTQKAQALEDEKDLWMQGNAMLAHLGGNPFAVMEQFHDVFPGDNLVPEGGCWVLVKTSPPTQWTVPPLSIWFVEPWPMQNESRFASNRVRCVTPRGDLGLFPREYQIVRDPGKYFEFIGDGMEVKFFGPTDGVPKDALFYLRSRGVAKRDALAMLIGEIRAPGVLWMESSPDVCAVFGKEFPAAERLATIKGDNES